MAVRSTLTRDIGKARVKLERFFPEMAKRSSEIVHEEVVKRTPRGEVVDPETGTVLGPSDQLRNDIHELPPRREGSTWVSGAYTENDHAGFVEGGTRAHPIPRPGTTTVLRYWSDGQLWHSRRVQHPGTQGKHMFARGLVAAERRIQLEGQARLDVIFS